MASIPAPPPPPPPPLITESPSPQLDGPVTSDKETIKTPSPAQSNAGDVPLHPSQLRELSRNWTLAGDAGLLLYLHDFSQRIISKTSEIDKVVDTLANFTKGSTAKVHNTFNDFLMLSSNQFIENRVYDEEVSEDKNEKEVEEKPEKNREQLEAEVLPRYSQAVEFGLGVLDDAFITVEIKPAEDDDSDEDDETSIHATVADPIIEPRDLYSGRPLPHLIGTAEFLHDETLGLVEIESDDEEQKKNLDESEDESEDEEEGSMEDSDGNVTTSDEEEEEDSDIEEEPVKKKKKQPVDVDSDDESDDGLFGDEQKKEKTDKHDEESEEENEAPQGNFQAELASKLGLAQAPRKKTLDEDSDTWDTESHKQDDVSSVSSKNIQAETKSISSRRSTGSKSKRGHSVKSETESITSTKNEKRGRSKSGKKSETKHKKMKEVEEDDNLFGAPKKDDFFADNNDEPFAKKSGGLFSGGGNSLFDENEEEEDLFQEKKEEKIFDDDIETKDSPPKHCTTSNGKKLPAGAVSIFGDTDSLFGSPKKDNVIVSKAGSPPSEVAKKPPPVVSGLFDEDEEDDMFSTTSKSNLSVKSENPRKKTLELENDKEDDEEDLFGSTKKLEEPPPAKTQKKIPVGGVSMFGGKPPQLPNKNVSKPEGAGLFSNDDKDDLFGNNNTDSPKLENSSSKPVEKKNNIISLFDDGEEEEDDDIFAGLLTAKPSSARSQPSKLPKQTTPSKSMLFDDDDEDELFGEPVTTKKTPQSSVKTSEPEKGHSNTTQEKKSSSMFSGGGLFGEKDDLFTTNTNQSNLKNETSQSAETDQKPSSEIKKKQIKTPISDPFNDDDDDDLFSPMKKNFAETKQQGKEKSDQKANKLNEKKQIKTVTPSLFDEDEDEDLFGGKPKTIVVDKKPVENEKLTESIEKEKVKKNPGKPTGGVSMFGSIDPPVAKNTSKPPASDIFDEESDDDIFGSGKKNRQEPETRPNIVAASPEEEEEELFSGSTDGKISKPVLDLKTESVKEGIQSSANVPMVEDKDDFTDSKPKKPIGGVSLFGGIDPLSAKKNLQTSTKGFMFGDDSDDDIFTKKRGPVSKPKVIPKEVQKKTETLTKAAVDPLSALGSLNPPPVKPSLNSEVEQHSQVESKQTDVSNTTTPGSVEKLQASLNFNPAALLPGSSPPKKIQSTIAASFDEPADAKTLESYSKTRVKGQAKRRPPSRKGRQGNTTNKSSLSDSVDGVLNMPSERDIGEQAVSTLGETPSQQPPPQQPSQQLPSQQSPKSVSTKPIKSVKPSDIFADDDDDDIFSPKAKKNTTNDKLFSNANEVVSSPITSQANVLDSHPEKDTLSSTSKNPSIFEDEDDIFSNATKKDVFSEKKSSTALFNEDDDIFGGTTQSRKSPSPLAVPISGVTTQSKKSLSPLAATIPGNADVKNTKDDKPTSSEKPTPVDSKSDDDLFSADKSDIFGTPSKQQEGPDTTKIQKKLGNQPLNAEDDDSNDDLFSKDKMKKKKETSKSKQKVVKKKTDEDLFGNSDSIFNDIPSSKEKKKKKKKIEKDIFATTSEADDIFAPRKTKTKRKTPETETTTKTKSNENIFNENVPSLIADPLNALSGT